MLRSVWKNGFDCRQIPSSLHSWVVTVERQKVKTYLFLQGADLTFRDSTQVKVVRSQGSNVKVPHLACKVWVRSLFSLKRWGCVKYRINTDLFLSTQPMSTNSLLTPCKQGAVLSRYSLGLGNDVSVETRSRSDRWNCWALAPKARLVI